MGIVRYRIKCSLLRIQQRLTLIALRQKNDGDKGTALCCIGKNENRYVREFVEWYRKIGFSRIFIYDNNDPDGERFESVIQDYIDDGFVEITDFRGRKICQMETYQDCYLKHRSEYGWMAFFDMDEFLDLKQDRNVGEFLSRDIFRRCDLIHINWICYGDNGHLHYSDAPLTERFPEPAPADSVHSVWNCRLNDYIKSIVRCNSKVPLWWRNIPHTPFPSGHRCCNADGTRCGAEECSYRDKGRSLAYLRHYTTKSTEEYLDKVARGYADQIMQRAQLENMLELYFDLNTDTEDKRRYMSGWAAVFFKEVQ